MVTSFALDIISLLILLVLFQGIFMGILLLNHFKKDPQSHFLLGLMIGFVIWLLLEFLAVREGIVGNNSFLIGTRHGSWLIIGPLWYLFSQSQIKARFRFSMLHLLHFVPFIFFGIGFNLSGQAPLAFPEVGWFLVGQFLHVAIYLGVTINDLYGYKLRLKNTLSNIGKINLAWLRHLTLALTLVLLFCTALMSIFYFTNHFDWWVGYSFVIPLALITYFLSFQAMVQPQFFQDDFLYLDPSSLQEPELSTHQVQLYQDRLLQLMKEKKPYLNSELQIKDLAQALDLPPENLSQVINQKFKLTFLDFVNRYRIEEAKERIAVLKAKGEDLIHLAFEVGFNNKTSFLIYFKKYTGLTPNKFLEKEIWVQP